LLKHKMLEKLTGILGFALALAATSASAQSLVFHRAEQNDGWWLAQYTVRVTGTSVNGFSLATINRARDRVIGEEGYCYVEAVTRSGTIGVDRVTQSAVTETFNGLADDPFQLTATVTGGRAITAQVFAFEECSGRTGLAIIVFEGSHIRRVLEQNPEGSRHFWYLRRASEGHIEYSSCFFCGDISAIYFDATANRVYTEYLGD
jgi:hypothetical protein